MGAIIIFTFLMAVLFGVMLVTSFLKGIARIFVHTDSNRARSANDRSSMNNHSSKTKKVFGKNEGKYISYEELRD